MNKKGFIFDLDGVIVDTAKYHFLAWKRLAKSLDIDFTEEENEQLKGVSRIKSLEKIVSWGNKTISKDQFTELMGKKNDEYLSYIADMGSDEILPDVPRVLNTLLEKKQPISLGSASKNAVPVLKFLDMLDFFEVIIDGTKTTKGKPDPQVFQMGAEALGVKPEETVVFEDAVSGVQAALNGGFTAVGCGSPENLGHAHHVVAGLNEVTEEWISKL